MPADVRSFQRPGLLAGVCVAAGAWSGLVVDPSRNIEIGAGLGLVFGALVCLRLRGAAGAIGAAVFTVACGLIAGQLSPRGHDDPSLDAACNSDNPVHFVGRIVEPLSRRHAPPRWLSHIEQLRLSLVVDVDAVELDGRWRDAHARVWMGAEDVPVAAKVGDEVEGAARFMPLSGPSNPTEPDVRPRLLRGGISYFAVLERGALSSTKLSSGLDRKAEIFRERFTAFVRQRLGDNDRAALVSALAVGERGGVSVDLNQAFNASGLAHVLSISGLHLAVAVVVLAWVLRRLFALSATLSTYFAPRRLAAAVALPMTAIYIIVIGAPAPAVRAGLATGLTLLGIALGRDTDVLNTLGWSLAAVGLIDPVSLDQPSTQLSFLGVAGLAYFSRRIREWIPVAHPDAGTEGARRWFERGREAVLELVLTTVSATLATAPITAFYFERASIVAAAANVVAWPSSTLIVPSGALAALVFPVAPGLAGYLVDIASWCAAGLSWCASFFGNWSLAALYVPSPSPLAIGVYGAFVICLVNIKHWPLRPTLAACVALLITLLSLTWHPLSRPGQLEVTFLSVGQGDSTVIRFPDGPTMVVDAGGVISQRFDPGDRLVAPFLHAQGISHIDVLVASHPHPDHIGGLPALVRHFSIGELWHNGDVHEPGPLADLIELAHDHGAVVTSFAQPVPKECEKLPPLAEVAPEVAALAVGDPRCAAAPPRRVIDGVTIEILHPLNGPERSAFPELGENDNSLVLRLTYGDVHVLLPGDVEKDGEAVLLSRGADLSAQILKAPHHGSKTSSTDAFVRAVHPKYVVFCVGLHNQFGFPSALVQDRYAQAGCTRYRTDLDGAITFTTDGHDVKARPFLHD